MITLLAQSQNGDVTPQGNVFENMISIFSRPDTLAHPEDLIPPLQAMSVVWSVIFLAAGLVCLLQGYRIYRPVTVILAFAIGAFAGYRLGQQINAEYIVAGCMGALMAVTCFRMMKYAVAIMGGLAGAFISANAWTAIVRLFHSGSGTSPIEQYHWISAAVGLLFGGMLAFILFKMSVVLFTSVSGATVAVLGGVALLLQMPSFSTQVRESISAHSMVVPLLVLVPAAIGFILQESQDDTPNGNGARPTTKPAS